MNDPGLSHLESRNAVRRSLPYLVIVISALVLSSSLLPWTDWPDSQEHLRYFYLLDHFRDAVRHGVTYPRWLPNAFGGYGYPTFVYYQPGFFYWCLPLTLVIDDLPLSVYLSLATLIMVGAIGAYQLCKFLTDRATGLCGAIWFLLTPYLYVNLYVRGDLSELMAMLLVPWPCYFCLRLTHEANRSFGLSRAVVGLALSTAMVIFSHPATALFLLGIVFGAGVLWRAFGVITNARLAWLCLALGLAVALAVPYWVPALWLRDFVAHESAITGFFTPSSQAVYLDQFFTRDWQFGFSMPGRGDAMSFQIGLPHFVLAVAGGVAQWRRPLYGVILGLYLGLLLFMTPWFGFIWDQVLFLRFVQFPWRILSVTATLQVVCVAGLHRRIAKMRSARYLVVAFVGLMTVGWHLDQFFANPNRLRATADRIRYHQETNRTEFRTYAAVDEFTPRTAALLPSIGPRTTKPLVELVAANGREVVITGDEYRIRAIVSKGAGCDFVINQAYFPGWQVRLDGHAVSTDELERQRMPDGRIRLAMDRGQEHEVLAFYGGPPGGVARSCTMAGALIILASLLRAGYVSGTGIVSEPRLPVREHPP